MKEFTPRENKKFMPYIDVSHLWSLVEKAGQLDEFINSTENVPVVNLTEFGYFKVIGGGDQPIKPIVVKARQFTPEAERKIVAAGGQCLLTV